MAKIVNNTFIYNVAANGGCVFNTDFNLDFYNDVFLFNSALVSGGVLWMENGFNPLKVNFVNCNFHLNNAFIPQTSLFYSFKNLNIDSKTLLLFSNSLINHNLAEGLKKIGFGKNLETVLEHSLIDTDSCATQIIGNSPPSSINFRGCFKT